MTASAPHPRPSRLMNILLWFLAVLLMFASIIYQRRTGPTYPLRGALEISGESHPYRLVRSEWSHLDARVILPAAGAEVEALLRYKRFNTEDSWSEIPFQPADRLTAELGTDEAARLAGKLVALLPRQPAAGKLQYYIEGRAGGRSFRVPATGDEDIVIRFKDHVPTAALAPHVLLMFFAVLFGLRAGLAAVFAPSQMRFLSWTALIGMTLGGMILGPIVQKYAFGAYWTGFPFGGDLTDNKMLVMWLSWIFACSVIGLRPKPRELVPRAAVFAGALVMTAVYLIPHSMRGSELDYSKLEQGVPVHEAIGTSKD
jgi:hypothetical protein